MPISEKYRERIKESMDLDEGGKLHAIADKAKAVGAPVLIIGLGGTGMDSLLKTKKLIYDTIQPENLGNTYSDKPENIEYIGFDTDAGYENKVYQGMRLNKQAKEVNIMLMPNVQPVVTHPEMLPPYINKWLDETISVTQVTAGAGGVRQLGRLLLMQNLGDMADVIRTKIDKVTNGFEASIPLYVFILAGISGGTGSGTFIDIPYLVKAISETRSNRPVKNIGILFMPDANENRSGINEVGRQSIYANGFAALKELDYLMNIEEVGDCFAQDYGTVKTGTSSTGAAIPPYDICLLMSSKDKNGAIKGTGDDNYNNLTSVVAETVFNFVLGDSGKTNFEDFSISSWLSNEVKNIDTYKTMMGDLRHPVSYRYSIAGASSAQLPLDDIMSYLAYKAFKEVENFWQKAPTEQDVETVKTFFHLGRRTIESEAMSRLPMVDTSRVTAKVLKDQPNALVQLCEITFKKQREHIVANLEKMLEDLQSRVDAKENIIRQYLLDMEKGPVFAQQCLYSSYHEHSLITDLSKLVLDFSRDTVAAEQIDMLNISAGNALTDVRKSLADITGNKLKKYVNIMQTLYSSKLKNFLYEQLQTFCNNASGILHNANNEIFNVISDLMEQMMKIFEKYGRIKSATELTKNASGTTLSWHVIDTPKFVVEVEKRMEEMPEFSVNLQQIVRNFYVYLLDNCEKWRGENYDVVEEINTFIFRQFNNILDNSMEFFLEIIAQSSGKTLDQYCNEIINTLIEKAEVRYPIDQSFAVHAMQPPKYSFISVPSNCPTLLRCARDTVSTGSIVKTSGIKDRIFMMNFESATPLSLNPDMKQFYTAYIRHRKAQSGLHLYLPTRFGDGTNWKNLPSPLPETEWGSFEDEQEHKRNEIYRSIFAKALEYGYVKEDLAERSFVCRYGELVDVDRILKELDIVLGEEKSITGKDAKRAVNILKSELLSDKRLNKSISRKSIISKDEGKTLDKKYEEIMFIQMFRVRDEIQKMVENHEAVMEAIREIKARAVDDSVVYTFVQCRILRLVDKMKGELGSYIYLDRKGAAQPLVHLDGRKMKHQEYYLLDSFIKTSPERKAHLAGIAEEKINDAALSEDNKKMLDIYKKKMIDVVLDDLNYDYMSIENGESILTAYQMLKAACDDVAMMFGTGSGDEEDLF